MKWVLVWDLPVRIGHVLMGIGVIAAYGIARFLGEDHPSFPHHMMIGMALMVLVGFRTLWGFIGPRPARFESNLLADPVHILDHLKNFNRPGGTPFAGKNPLSFLSTLTILGLIAGLGITGYATTQGNERFESLHPLLANALAVMVGLHILGAIHHHWVKRDDTLIAMVHGKKRVEESNDIGSPRPLAALAMLVLSLGGYFSLLWNYDSKTQTTRLPFAKQSISLGESEQESGAGESEEHERHEED